MFALYTLEPEYVVYTTTTRGYRPTAHCCAHQSRRQSYPYPRDSIYDVISSVENGYRQAQLQHAREQKYRQWLIDQKRKHEALKQSYARRTAANRAHSQQSNVPAQQSKKKKNNNKTDRRIPTRMYSRQEAAQRIVDFLERRTAIRHTRTVLHKLSYLRKIQTQLKVLRNQYKASAISLIFRTEHSKTVLPILENNKFFLKHEDAIFKLLDLLDRVETKGVDIVRGRRKESVDLAQEMLEELDQIKETQWKAFVGTEHEEKQNVTDESAANDQAASSVNVETAPVEDTNGDLSDYKDVEKVTPPESNDENTIQPYSIAEPAPASEPNDNTVAIEQTPETNDNTVAIEQTPETNDNTVAIEQTPETLETENLPNENTTTESTVKEETESIIADSTPQTLEIETTSQQREQQASSAIDEEAQVVQESNDEASVAINELEDESNIVNEKPELVNNEEDFVIVDENEWTEQK